MLHFYGFVLSQNGTDSETIIPGPNFPHASPNWLKRFNHNHLRITRIIRSLRVLGLEKDALRFHQALVSVYDDGKSGIGAKSMMFWFVFLLSFPILTITVVTFVLFKPKWEVRKIVSVS